MRTFDYASVRNPDGGSPDHVESVVIGSMRRRTELLLLGVLSLFYLVIYGFEVVELYHVSNWIGPSLLFVVLATSCYHIVAVNPVSIWAPLFWFRLACAVYFGVGAIVPYIADDATLAAIQSLFFFNDADLLKVNFVVTVSIFTTLAFAYGFLRPGRTDRAVHRNHIGAANTRRRTLLFAVGFLLAGGAIRYGLSLPFALGLADTTVAGMFLTLGKTYYVGIYLLIVYALTFNKSLISFIVSLIIVEIAVSIATFAKTELLLILIFSFLGFISRGANYVRVVLGTTLVLSAYFLFQPLVAFGRAEVNISHGGRAGLEERLAIVQTYLVDGPAFEVADSQAGLARLSYVNSNAFVINQYDSGFPGSTLEDAAAVFIPRVLWPNKPIITRLGPELYYLVRGHGGTALGVGHFAEAYWNFGWVGIPPFMAVLALILSVFTKVSMRIMARKDWLMLPVVFLGVNLGLRVDGHFVPDVLGAGWMALVLGVALAVGRTMVLTLAFPGKTVIR